jgi:hypothetical protein
MLTSHEKFGRGGRGVHFCHDFSLGAPTKMPRMPLYKPIMKRTNYVRRFASYFSWPVEHFRGWGSEDETISRAIFAGFVVRQWKEICPPGTLSGVLPGGKKRGLTYSVKSDLIQFKSKSFNKPSLRS